MTKENRGRQAFIEEAREDLLPELENTLVELARNPADPELIHRTFRALHTLKGSGAMFGLEQLSELAHEMESVFDHIRNGRAGVNNHLVELTLAAKDQIQLLVDDPDAVAPATLKDLITAFRQMAPADDRDQSSPGEEQEEADKEKESSWNAYHIRFQPGRDIFRTGNNPLFLLDELQGLGTTRIIAHLEAIPLLEELDPEACYTWWDILLATDKPENIIRDVFIFVENDCELAIECLGQEIPYGQEDPAFDELSKCLSADQETDLVSLREQFAAAVPAAATDTNKTGTDPAADRPSRPTSPAARSISSMRVPAAKLDQLVNLVGELVIAQTRLSRLAEQKADAGLMEIAETIERLSNDLRENTLDIRMLPIGSSFGKFKRVVWDLSGREGKQVDLITEGAATELDKTVIERLDDPLVHLLRNSIDHGIESPAERQAAGKPRQGRIVFAAEHSGGNVVITIRDDGRGIDPAVVRDRALEKGLLAPDNSLTDKELLNLIFEPGFSTAEKVSDMSGRGVGMDVVKQNITALRGKVRVTSDKGQGTAVRITLPLTLAIIDGLRVRIGREYFIVPLGVVSECLELDGQQKPGRDRDHHQGRFINLRDQLVPFLSLREWFSINGQRPDREQVVIVAADKQLVGLIVDEVVGLQQAVIKNLGETYKDVQGLSGATIQGDGSLALILDVEPLVLKAREQT
ncbi:MAG: chemotaxis protein CheA [Desulfosudaceae bacterium]